MAQIDIMPNNQTITIPLLQSISSSAVQSRQAIHLILLLAGLCISVALSAKVVRVITSTVYFPKFSQERTKALNHMAKSISTLQDQIDSLERVIPQNK